MNVSQFSACLIANSTKASIGESRENALAVGIYGTPTFIIGEEVLVGPQKKSVLRDAVKKALG